MQPPDDRGSDEPRYDEPNALPRAAPGSQETRVLTAVSTNPTVARVRAVPAELSGLLLPTEAVTFASSPHWIVFVPPIVALVILAIALETALGWKLHPIVRGHHTTRPLLMGSGRPAAIGFAILLALRELWALGRRLFHFLGYRVISTNRRVFIVEGILGRRVRPLGNTALAGARLRQGIFGRTLGFGTIELGDAAVAASSSGRFVDMNDPIGLYRACEGVAMGVDGDTWVQPIRQVQLP